jgi:hypothetical protein
MPLSEHERQLFEGITRPLAEDPKFMAGVRAARRRHVTEWSIPEIFGGLLALAVIVIVVIQLFAGSAGDTGGAGTGPTMSSSCSRVWCAHGR